MRISKEVAHQVAIKLAEKKKQLLDKAEQEYSRHVTDEYLKQIPKAVLDFNEKNKGWLSTASSISFSGHGFRWANVDATGQVIESGKNNATLVLTPKLATKLKALETKRDNARQVYRSLVKEIETALLGLRTFTQIEKNLPEAAPFLPKSSTMGLMVNFSDLRKKIS